MERSAYFADVAKDDSITDFLVTNNDEDEEQVEALLAESEEDLYWRTSFAGQTLRLSSSVFDFFSDRLTISTEICSQSRAKRIEVSQQSTILFIDR